MDSLTKTFGSLGRLEEWGIRYVAIRMSRSLRKKIMRVCPPFLYLSIHLRFFVPGFLYARL